MLNPMKKTITLSVAAALFLTSAAALADEKPDELLHRLGGGNAQSGQIKSATHLCQECHNVDGNSESSGVPKLSGQSAAYLFKQLKNFQSGERDHPTMNAMASGISNQDLADIAAYFSTQVRPLGNGGKLHPVAKELFSNGDWQRNIIACKTCHGVQGRGNGNPSYPVIGGQHQIYVREQLLNWRSGSRKNSEGEVMNAITQRLTDAEIEALAEYVSGL